MKFGDIIQTQMDNLKYRRLSLYLNFYNIFLLFLGEIFFWRLTLSSEIISKLKILNFLDAWNAYFLQLYSSKTLIFSNKNYVKRLS